MQLEISLECSVCHSSLEGVFDEDGCVGIAPCRRCMQEASVHLEIQRRSIIEMVERLRDLTKDLPPHIEALQRWLMMLSESMQKIESAYRAHRGGLNAPPQKT